MDGQRKCEKILRETEIDRERERKRERDGTEKKCERVWIWGGGGGKRVDLKLKRMKRILFPPTDHHITTAIFLLTSLTTPFFYKNKNDRLY